MDITTFNALIYVTVSRKVRFTNDNGRMTGTHDITISACTVPKQS